METPRNKLGDAFRAFLEDGNPEPVIASFLALPTPKPRSDIFERIQRKVKAAEVSDFYAGFITANAPASPGLTVEALKETWEKLRHVVICTAIWFIDHPDAYSLVSSLIEIRRGAFELD